MIFFRYNLEYIRVVTNVRLGRTSDGLSLNNDSTETSMHFSFDTKPETMQYEANNQEASNNIVYINQHIIWANDDGADQSSSVSEPNHIDSNTEVTNKFKTTVIEKHNESKCATECRETRRPRNKNLDKVVFRTPEAFLTQILHEVSLPARSKVNKSEVKEENTFLSKDDSESVLKVEKDLLYFNQKMELHLRCCVMHHHTLLT